MESSILTRRSVESGQPTTQKPCYTPFRPRQPGSSVHAWHPGDRMDFLLPFCLPLFIQSCGQQRFLHPQQALKGRDRETCQPSKSTTFPTLNCTDIHLQFWLKEILFFFPFACILIFKKPDGESL